MPNLKDVIGNFPKALDQEQTALTRMHSLLAGCFLLQPTSLAGRLRITCIAGSCRGYNNTHISQNTTDQACTRDSGHKQNMYWPTATIQHCGKGNTQRNTSDSFNESQASLAKA